MKYMVIENFKPGMTDQVYARFREKGRMLPDGVRYLDSWLSDDRMARPMAGPHRFRDCAGAGFTDQGKTKL